MPEHRQLLPTPESAAGIRAKYDLAVRQRSLFSARTTQIRYLESLRNVLDAWEEGRIRQDQAEEILSQKLAQLGYDPATGGFPGDGVADPLLAGAPLREPLPSPPSRLATETGALRSRSSGKQGVRRTLRDLSSHARLDFVLRHQQAFARSLARKAEAASDPVSAYLFPAWRLVRAGKPNVPRNWVPRWASAFAACGGEGAHRVEFVALNSSPIWAALGEVGDDGTGSDVPPFAYNSTMDWEGVEREECIRLGLIREDEEPTAPAFGDGEAFAGIDKALADLSDEDAAQLERELEAMARGEGIANEALRGSEVEKLSVEKLKARNLSTLQPFNSEGGTELLANANPYHCPKCGKFAGFDGHCAKCGHAPEGKAARARAAALLEKAARDAYAKPVRGIAWREELGRIDLEIGYRGEWDARRKARGHGTGLSKIREKHDEKLSMLPDTLAFGQVLRTRQGDKEGEPETPNRRAIVHGEYVAYLQKKGDAWIVASHYRENEGKRRRLEENAATLERRPHG